VPKVTLKLGRIEALAEKLRNNKPAFAMIKARLIEAVADHLKREEGPDGRWEPRSSFTKVMAERSKGIKIHTGGLLKNRGTFGVSFGRGATSGQNRAAVGSALKTPDGKHNLAAIHHEGVDIAVTPKMIGWFKHNFGLRLKTNAIRIPARPVLWLSADEKKDILEILSSFYSGQAA